MPLLPSPPTRRDFWSVDAMDEMFRGGQQLSRQRRYSEQDLKTRYARASISNPQQPQQHIPVPSYPIYTPLSQQLEGVDTSPNRCSGLQTIMEAPRLHPRSVSFSGSNSPRSSFESRLPSPLSRSLSADWDSTSTTATSLRLDEKHTLLSSGSPIPRTALPGKQLITEPIVPHYNQGAHRRRFSQSNMPIQDLPSSSRYTFGKQYTPRIRGEGFKKLPEEILLVILAELKKSHLGAGSLSCATCWMRDVVTLGLTCKKWWAAARIALYEDIQLVGTDSLLHTKKRYKMKHGTRIKLLRRTLRARPDLAQYVKSLKVPATPEGINTKEEEEMYLDSVASLIMACPNLERLAGTFPPHNYSFSRITQALSTRTKLTEKVWTIGPSFDQPECRYQLSDDCNMPVPILAPGILTHTQCLDFLSCHSNWMNLQTLVLHCNAGGTLDSLLFTDIFHSLPSLDNLYVSNFPAASFNDETLLSLPSLKSLRLERLSGLTATGLSAFASPSKTHRLMSLALISIPILSIPVIARLFSNLHALTRFTISQTPSPFLPVGDEIWLYPYFASQTLQYLHWEFTNSEDEQATQILAKSIRYAGFPSLRTIRAPSDSQGTLQRLCFPRAKIELPSDKYRNMSSRPPMLQSRSGSSPTRSTFSSGHASSSSSSSSIMKSPTRSSFSSPSDRLSHEEIAPPKRISLSNARRQAQQRIDSSTQVPQYHIIVCDEEGRCADRVSIGFLGDIRSRISYSLKPDVDGSDEAIIGMEALMDRTEEKECRDPCTGAWNLETGNGTGSGSKRRESGIGKKGKDRWWHSERGRWKEIELRRLF